jgi:serine/threonine protein kinase
LLQVTRQEGSKVTCPSCNAENDAAVEVCFTCGRALHALTQGTLIGTRYEIVSVLGRGGMGMVYKAMDHMLEEPVAIKVLRSEWAGTQEMARRFRSEIKLARKVSHRNVCRIHEYGEDGALRFICMEWLEGADLKRELQAAGGLSTAQAFDVCIQVGEGLQAIHDVGIIHRDLKTSNIMRDGRGVVRLMDFGIAKASDETGAGSITSTGQVMGTPEYMSPEQCRGEKIDFRSDVYSLGIVFYEIFTGQVPFRGDTPVATLFKHIQEPVPLEGPAAARIPESVVPVLRKALAKERSERYASVSEMIEALADARKRTPMSTAPQPIAAAAPAPPSVTAATAARSMPPPTPTTSSRPTAVKRAGSGAHAAANAAAAAPPLSTAARMAYSERRREGRLDIFVNLNLKRTATDGSVVQEERTIAENIGRGGARVMTAMTALAAGDVLLFEEVGGSFNTRAEIRNVYMGRDNIRRLNLRFIDHQAPDRLVHTEAAR